jgi:hypothetical protein
MRRPAFVTLAVVVGSLTYSPHAYAGTLYGLTFFTPQLIRIDQTTAVSAAVGPVTAGQGSELAAFADQLYAFDQNGDIFRRINPANAGTLSSTTAGIDVFGEGGMSFQSPAQAFLSGSEGTSGRLFRCDVTVNNGCSEVGVLTIAMDALAFGPGGVLFGLSQAPTGSAQPTLYTINPVTAAIALVGPTGLTGVNLAGMAFDPDTGNLYAAIGSNLYTINMGSGAATLVGNTGFSNYAGLAFITAIPEPGTLGLAAAAALGLLLVKRKTRPWRRFR